MEKLRSNIECDMWGHLANGQKQCRWFFPLARALSTTLFWHSSSSLFPKPFLALVGRWTCLNWQRPPNNFGNPHCCVEVSHIPSARNAPPTGAHVAGALVALRSSWSNVTSERFSLPSPYKVPSLSSHKHVLGTFFHISMFYFLKGFISN